MGDAFLSFAFGVFLGLSFGAVMFLMATKHLDDEDDDRHKN